MTANRELIENLSIKKITIGERLSQSEAKELARTFPREIINEEDQRAVNFPVSAVGKIYSSRNHNTIRIIENIPELYRTSIIGWSEPEIRYEGHKAHANIEAFHHYLNRFTDGKEEFFLRITVKESKTKNKSEPRNEVHTATVSDVSVYGKSDFPQLDPVNMTGGKGQAAFIDRKLQKFLNC